DLPVGAQRLAPARPPGGGMTGPAAEDAHQTAGRPAGRAGSTAPPQGDARAPSGPPRAPGDISGPHHRAAPTAAAKTALVARRARAVPLAGTGGGGPCCMGMAIASAIWRSGIAMGMLGSAAGGSDCLAGMAMGMLGWPAGTAGCLPGMATAVAGAGDGGS